MSNDNPNTDTSNSASDTATPTPDASAQPSQNSSFPFQKAERMFVMDDIHSESVKLKE